MFSLNFKNKVAASALALSFVASSAMAVTTTTTITFNDSDGNFSDKTYTSQGYEFVPVNLNNDTKCSDATCTKELGQDLPTLTRTDDSAFSLFSFYFSIIGEGPNNANSITVEGFSGSESVGYSSKGSITLTLDKALSTFSSQNVTVTYAKGATGAACTNNADSPLTVLCKNAGYVADVSQTGFFTDVTKIAWDAPNQAQALIDDVVLSDIGAIPVPAGLPLLLTAMGLGGFMSWRKRKTV